MLLRCYEDYINDYRIPNSYSNYPSGIQFVAYSYGISALRRKIQIKYYSHDAIMGYLIPYLRRLRCEQMQ